MDPEYLLFRTQIGDTFRAFDPWRIDRLLAVALGGERVGKVVAASRSTDPEESFQATEALYNAARSAFALPPVAADGSGIGETTVRRILGEWFAFKAAVKKNTGFSPTSSAPTAPTPAGNTSGAT